MNDKVESEKYSNGKWIPDLNNGSYKNPILFADYSDPDVARVGDDYFLISSSFNCVPGIPILHSKDLVNWKIVNHVFDKLPFDYYKTPQHGKGAWAPSLKYHDGKLWVFFCTPDEGIFMSNTEDPFGKWSPLHHVKKAYGWIDCCPFWDDDGKAYLIHAFAKSRAGFNNLLELCDMTPDGKEVSNRRLVFNANDRHIVMEGPKMFKRNGYYYITAPAGGIEHGYQVVMRSKSIEGPYEDKIVMHEGNNINGPRQGNFVDTPNGEEWFIHFRDMGAYGRVAYLEPVNWSFGWPIIGVDIDNDGIGEAVSTYSKPNTGVNAKIEIPQTTDEFDGNELDKQWQWNANYEHDWSELGCRKSCLRLFSSPLPQNKLLLDYPNLCLQKFPSREFTVTTKLFLPCENSDRAGIIVTGNTYCYLYAELTNGNLTLSQICGNIDEKYEKSNESITIPWDYKDGIYLKVHISKNAECSFSYSKDGLTYKSIGKKAIVEKELWIGAKVGLFCYKDGAKTKNYCDFDYFRVE